MSRRLRIRHRSVPEERENVEKYKFDWFGNRRLICDVLEDMRKCVETTNFGFMKGLIEEAQIMSNRMESALSNQKDLIKLDQELSKAHRAYKKLEREYESLYEKVDLKRPKKK